MIQRKYIFCFADDGFVDAESGLEKQAHIYCAEKYGRRVSYSVVLSLVQIENNKNSYYRLQLLESNDKKNVL